MNFILSFGMNSLKPACTIALLSFINRCQDLGQDDIKNSTLLYALRIFGV